MALSPGKTIRVILGGFGPKFGHLRAFLRSL